MIFLDLSSGVTFSLLLKGVATAIGYEPLIRDLAAVSRPYSPLAAALCQAWSAPSVDDGLIALHTACAGLSPVEKAEAEAEGERFRIAPKNLLAITPVNSIDPFEFSAYISIAVLLGRGTATPRLLVPGIGAGSPESVFSIISNTAVTISPAAPAISPFLAAVLKVLFVPFAEHAHSGAFIKMVSVKDPLAPRSTARVFYFEDEDAGTGMVAVIEANLDDMSPEILSRAMRLLLEKGALDYTVVPVIMKKGRPGFTVSVLARPEDRERMEELLLLHTSTFGVRTTIAERRILERTTEYFESSYGRLRIKKGFYRGTCIRSVPEYEDLAALSDERGIPLIRLYTAVTAEIARQST
jgi:hypothetical protein